MKVTMRGGPLGLAMGMLVAVAAMAGCDKGSSGGAAGSAGSADSIGIKECDDYIKKWDDCYKDPATRAAAKPGFDQMKSTWAQQAKDPNMKAGLSQGCKMALDSFPSAACH